MKFDCRNIFDCREMEWLSEWNGMIIVKANAVLDTVQRSINAFSQPKSEKLTFVLDLNHPLRFSPLPLFESTIREVRRRFSFFISFFFQWIRRALRDVLYSWSQYNERFHIWCVSVSIHLYSNPPHTVLPQGLGMFPLVCQEQDECSMWWNCWFSPFGQLSIQWYSDTVLLTVSIISLIQEVFMRPFARAQEQLSAVPMGMPFY